MSRDTSWDQIPDRMLRFESPACFLCGARELSLWPCIAYHFMPEPMIHKYSTVQ